MDPHRGNGNLFLLAATFLSLTSKKNFGLALLSLKSVLGKKLCLHYDQISKYPIHLGLDYLQYHGNLLKNQVEQGFFLNIFIAIYDYLPIFLNWSTSKGTQTID